MARKRFLIVEDDLTLQETLVYNLTHQGYSVENASDGNSAVDDRT
jgi:DNA-binding response OmpR family regulator